MLNATVRAAATGLPAAIFNRRRMLLGLAAASTAAAGPVAVAAGAPASAEDAELLDLGAKTAFVLKDYRKAVEARDVILKAWGPQWPEVPKTILNYALGARRAPTLEDDEPICQGDFIWKREKLLENIAYYDVPSLWRKNTKPERIARAEAQRLKMKAEREATLATLDAYDARCKGLVVASGIRSAQTVEIDALHALLGHVRAVMALEPASMSGVLIQAEALEAVSHVPQIERVAWSGNSFRFHEGYGELIATSILRIAGQS